MAKKLKLQAYLTRIEAAEKHRDSGYSELWKRCYKRWRNYADEIIDKETGKPADRSNISIPYTFVQVETILPRLVETLFASRPYVSVKDREPSDLPNAEKMETLLDWQMNERMDIQDIFHGGLKGCCIYGTSIAYTGWKWEQRPVIKKQPQPVVDEETGEPILDDVTGEPITELKPMKIDEIEYDDPEVKFIDLGLFYVDTHAEDIDDARYCGHVSYETKEHLQKMEKLGIYKIDWEKVPKDYNTNKARDDRMSSVGLPTNSQAEEGNDNLYEVIHHWEDDLYVVIINRAVMAREGDNPFWHKRKPYKKGVYTLVPHEFYGMGIVETIEDLQDELNTERNMRIDFRAFLLRRMFLVRKGSVTNKKQLKWRQGGIIEVESLEDVKEFGISDTSGSSFNQESVIKNDMQDATGGHDVVMGTSSGKETATSTMTKDNNASMRFKLIISNLEKRLLAGVARFIMQLDQQFIDNSRILRVSGENGDDWVEIPPEEIQGEFDLIAVGSSVEPMANKEAYKQRMIELYNVSKGDPILQNFPDKQRNILKKVFEAFDLKDIESLLPSDEEMQAQQQQQAIQARQQQQAMDLIKSGGGANNAMQKEGGLVG